VASIDRQPTKDELVRTYVVTGSASGIGRATAELLRASGHRVVGVDLHDADVVADLATPAGRTTLVDAVAQRTEGRIDAVIAAAGVGGVGSATVAVNYFGAVATLEGLRPLFARSSAPRAVVVASIGVTAEVDPDVVEACLSGNERAASDAAERTPHLAYTSTKRAIARWVRRQAPSPAWAGAGITLNAVGPGLVTTPMTADLLADPRKRMHLLERMPQPLGWPARPEQIAPALAWFASVENSMTTGQCLFVDGGLDAIRRGDDIW
jgi:NAD(P)-dependent dehydrogenase (short-subunit alcohol dehydrogenase family)